MKNLKPETKIKVHMLEYIKINLCKESFYLGGETLNRIERVVGTQYLISVPYFGLYEDLSNPIHPRYSNPVSKWAGHEQNVHPKREG